MTIRKRKNATPGFRMPAPFNAMAGQRAALQDKGDFPYCAMMQVVAEDEYDGYVTCRGYDPRHKRFYDYTEGDADMVGVSVAKPYGKRTPGVYQIGQVFPALLPLSRLGQNAGEATDNAGGQPDDLVETVELMKDHNDVFVNWLMLDAGVAGEIDFELKDGLDPEGSATAHPLDDAGDADVDVDLEFEVYDRWGVYQGREKDLYAAGATNNDLGSQGRARFNAESGHWEIIQLQPAALKIRGQLTAALGTGDAWKEIDGVTVMQPIGGIITDTDPGDDITVNNVGFAFAGDINGEVIAVWNQVEVQWEIIQVECPA